VTVLAVGSSYCRTPRAALCRSARRAAAAPHPGDVIDQVLGMELPLLDARKRLLDTFDARYIEHMLELYGGNVTRAAAAAGITRRHLQRMKAGHDEPER
jgi:DNA-binding NtrC family response regulator